MPPRLAQATPKVKVGTAASSSLERLHRHAQLAALCGEGLRAAVAEAIQFDGLVGLGLFGGADEEQSWALLGWLGEQLRHLRRLTGQHSLLGCALSRCVRHTVDAAYEIAIAERTVVRLECCLQDPARLRRGLGHGMQRGTQENPGPSSAPGRSSRAWAQRTVPTGDTMLKVSEDRIATMQQKIGLGMR
jgi:hypothetical protein